MNPLRIGIIGLGRIGKIHLKNLLMIPEVQVIAATHSTEAAKEYADRLGQSNIYSNYSAIIENDEIDAVVICSPTDTHADYVIAAAKSGKHVFCEKPLDLSLERVKEVLSVVDKSGVKMMVGFNQRFDPHFHKVWESIQKGQVGDPHILKITSRDPGPPPVSYIKSSGGLFLDMVIHDFDMARHLMGSEIIEVFAKGANRVDPAIGEAGDIDTAVSVLTFENGAIATIDTSRKATYGYDQRIEVFGSKGMIQIGNNTLDNHTFYDASGSHGAVLENFFLERYEKAYYLEMQAFINALQKGEPMPVSGNDGLMSMAIALAAGKSMKENRPVKIAEIL